jgi:hypothetical protein
MYIRTRNWTWTENVCNINGKITISDNQSMQFHNFCLRVQVVQIAFVVQSHTTQPRRFWDIRQNKQTKKYVRSIYFCAFLSLKTKKNAFCLLTLFRGHKVPALISNFCNLNNIQAIVIKPCDFSQNLSLNILLCQLFGHVTWRFFGSHVFKGWFTEI